MTCGDPNCNKDRERKMVLIKDRTETTPAVFCDPCIAPIIKALSDAGLTTLASCCGHHHRPGVISLADGRQLMILSWDDWRKAESVFPVDINGDTTKKPCPCGRDTCVEPWEPGCGLGLDPEHARIAPEHDSPPISIELNQTVRIRYTDAQGRRCTAFKTGQEIMDAFARLNPK